MADISQQDFSEGLVEAGGMVVSAIAGVPAPIKRSAIKAFSQLCSAFFDVPIAHLEGMAAEKRAESHARLLLIAESSKKISEKMGVSENYVDAASHKFAARIVREQSNLDAISKVALDDLRCGEGVSEDSNSDSEGVRLIGDDWLNNFEREASSKSSHEMQFLFGKILAGEVRKPSTFSIKTVRLLSQLDEFTASIFKKFCSIAINFSSDGEPIDARVVAVGEDKTFDPLKAFGLSFAEIMILQENGLLVSELETSMNFIYCVKRENEELYYLDYAGDTWYLEKIDEEKVMTEFRMSGPSFTRVGQELMGIVDVEENDKYTTAFVEYLAKLNVRLVKVVA